MALGNLAITDEVRIMFVQEPRVHSPAMLLQSCAKVSTPGLDALDALLNSENEQKNECLQYASRALARVAIDPESHPHIFSHTVFLNLLKYLELPWVDTSNEAEEKKDKEGKVDGQVTAGRSSVWEGVKYALMALCNLAGRPDRVPYLLSVNSLLPMLCKYLTSSGLDACVRYACMAVCNMGIHPESHQKMAGVGMIPPLIRLASSSKDTETQRYAGMALSNISAQGETRITLVQSGGLSSLVDLAHSDKVIQSFGDLDCFNSCFILIPL